MDVEEILKKAKEAVEKAGIPEDLKSKAFEKAIDLYSRNIPNTQSSFKSSGISNKKLESEHLDDNFIINEIAQELQIEPSLLEEIYYVEDGDLKIITATGQLETSNAGATKQIALLTAGGRQLGGMEDWTSTDTIRDICDYFGKYDSANFAKTIASMEDAFSQKGKGQKREVKLKRPGQERLKKLILELMGGNP